MTAAYTPVIKTVVSDDGTKLYAFAIGNPSRMPIVFAHGMNLSSLVWKTVYNDPRWLEKAYLIFYDLRGYGRSDQPLEPEAYAGAKIAQDYFAVLKAFDVKEKAFFVGWSMGASVCNDICAHAGSSSVRGFACVGGLACIGELLYTICIPSSQANFPKQLIKDDVHAYSAGLREFIDSTVTKSYKWDYELLMSWMGMAVSVPPEIRSNCLLRPQSLNDYVKDGPGSLPFLFMHGSDDGFVSGDALLGALKPVIGDSMKTHIIDGCGHAIFLEKPDEFRDVTLAFFESIATKSH